MLNPTTPAMNLQRTATATVARAPVDAAVAAGADGAPAAARAARSRAPLTTARRATACGSTPPSRRTPIYAEHWAGHRPVEVEIEEDRIVIRRTLDED